MLSGYDHLDEPPAGEHQHAEKADDFPAIHIDFEKDEVEGG